MAPCVDLETITTFLYIILRTWFYSVLLLYITPVAKQIRMGQGLLTVETSRPHSYTPHSVRLFWASEQPDAMTTHNTQTDIHAPGGIRIRNPRKIPASDPQFSRRGLGSTLLYIIITKIKVKEHNNAKIHKLGSHFQRQRQTQWAPSPSRHVQQIYIK